MFGGKGGKIFLLPLVASFFILWAALNSTPHWTRATPTVLTGARFWLEARLNTALGGPEKGLLAGLLFGGSGQFDAGWKKIFQLTGTSHLIAVSGMNVTFVSVFIIWCLSFVRRPPRQRFILLVAAIFFYVLMVGAPRSAVRAGLMAVATQLAPLFGRRASALHGLSLAVIVMLTINPSAVYDLGFQLSCLATLGLVVGQGGDKESTWWQEALLTTWWATMFTWPIVSYRFGVVSFVALPVNLLVVPLIPGLTLFGVVFLLTSVVFTPVARLLGVVLGTVLHAILEFLRAAAVLPLASSSFHIPYWFLILWYGGVLAYTIRFLLSKIRK